MALPKTDTFTVGSNQRISAYDANWKENGVQWTLVAATDDAYLSTADAGGEGACHWEGDTFSNDQYGQVTISSVSTNPRGAGCRVAAGTSTRTYYGYYGDTSNSYLHKVVAGTFGQLGSNAAAFATSNTIKVTASSTTITPYKNGSTTGTPGAQTDSAISSGYAGMTGYGTDTDARTDNFEGGNLGGTAYTITADAVGTYSVTGNAATLKVTRTLSAGQGTYTYTGNAAGVKYGYKLSVESGAYTYTGQSATLKLTRTLSAGTGQYTYTGNAASLFAGRKLALDAGSYSVTGQDASPKYGRKIAADAGSYTYTGNALSLLLGRKLVLDAGAYTYAGAAITINKGVRISLDAGAYTYTGNDGTFRRTYVLTGALGQYLYTGQDATLTYTPIGAYFTQEGFRWRNDDGNEAGATWKSLQDAMGYCKPETPIRLRVLVDASGDMGSSTFQLEARVFGSSDDWEVIA